MSSFLFVTIFLDRCVQLQNTRACSLCVPWERNAFARVGWLLYPEGRWNVKIRHLLESALLRTICPLRTLLISWWWHTSSNLTIPLRFVIPDAFILGFYQERNGFTHRCPWQRKLRVVTEHKRRHLENASWRFYAAEESHSFPKTTSSLTQPRRWRCPQKKNSP